MKLILISLTALTFLFSVNTYAEPSTSKSKSPTEALKELSQHKSHRSILNSLQNSINPDDYNYLEGHAKTLNINSKEPTHLKIIGKNKFNFSTHKDIFILSHNGNYLRYKKTIFKLDHKKSLMWNYKNIESLLKTTKSNSSLSIIPKAHAMGNTTGYDITILLYYMKSNTN